MEEKILKILGDLNEEALNYKGDNLYKDGILDSIQVIDLVVQLEEDFEMEIAPEMVILENFANKDTIINLIKKILEGQNAR